MDESDRAPSSLHVSRLDVILAASAVLIHLVDVGADINVAVRYYGRLPVAFWCTLVFLLVPAMLNTILSLHMYAQDKEKVDSLSRRFTKAKVLRVLVLVFQMAPMLRYADSFRYAVKSRRAEMKGDVVAQRKWYLLMLREDSDAALLRIFECFLESAPQQILQISIMLHGDEEFKIHQIISIVSSFVSMGWCLAGYQRAIRFAQEDKDNISWFGSILQIVAHFLITTSRIVSLSLVAYLFPIWTAVACIGHALIMAAWLHFYERTPFCTGTLGSIAFSFAMGLVYISTYIMPVEGRTRFRYTIYYTICFIEDVVCVALWVLYTDSAMKKTDFFVPLIVTAILPFIIGIVCMVLYYCCLHPSKRKGNHEIIHIEDNPKPERRNYNS